MRMTCTRMVTADKKNSACLNAVSEVRGHVRLSAKSYRRSWLCQWARHRSKTKAYHAPDFVKALSIRGRSVHRCSLGLSRLSIVRMPPGVESRKQWSEDW